MRESSCVVGKELVFTNSFKCESAVCFLQRRMGSRGSSWLGKADERSLFQAGPAPVPAGRWPPLMGASHASQTRTALWKRVTLTPCQTLRVTRTSSGPRYLCLAMLSERPESLAVKHNFSNALVSFIFFSLGEVTFPRGLFG